MSVITHWWRRLNWIWNSRAETHMNSGVVVMGEPAFEICFRCRSPNGIRKSRHSRRVLPTSRSQTAFALGARTGARNTRTPTRPVAVVNEAFVRRFFKGQNPIGQHFGMDRIQYAGSFEIVGVVRDMRYMTGGYKDPIRPMFWVPETQSVKYDDSQFNTFDLYSHFLDNIVIWAPGNPPGIEVEVRKALASIDPNLVVYGVNPYSEILAGDFQRENMIASLTMLFGVLGLVLAAVGLYGVMAYSVEQRTSEIGVRMALGADRSRVVRLVLRSAFSQIGIGLGLGIPLAMAAGRLMTEQNHGFWGAKLPRLSNLQSPDRGLYKTACTIQAWH